MKKIFEKHETVFCILLIVLYVVTNSYCIQNFGLTNYRSAIVNTAFSVALLMLAISLKRVSYYGLTKVSNLRRYLYFVPLLLIVSVNLWNGFNINNTPYEILFHFLTMLNVGFIEEIIFRGFLFKMMEKDNVKSAIIVSSITFGIGHIVNLLNGADFIPTVMQIFYLCNNFYFNHKKLYSLSKYLKKKHHISMVLLTLLTYLFIINYIAS